MSEHLQTFALRSRRVVFPDGVRPATIVVTDGKVSDALPFDIGAEGPTVEDVGDLAISPGVVDSGACDRLGDAKAGLLSKSAAGTLVGRYGQSDDVVDTVMWLLRAGFISGETVHLEGGARHKTS